MHSDSKIKIIGRREFVDFPLLDINNVEAKIDTGAYTSSFHCEKILIRFEDFKPVLYFIIDDKNGKEYRFENYEKKKIKNSFGEMEERYVIRTLVKIGGKRIWSTLSLSRRDSMRYQILIGRRLIKGKFLIDVSKTHTNGIRLNKKHTK